MWLIILSDQLGVIGLVGSYPTNYLIPYSLILWRKKRFPITINVKGVWGISSRFQLLSPSKGQINYTLLTRPPLS